MDDEFHFAMNNPMAKTNPNYKANNQPLHPKQPDYTNVVTKAWNLKTKEMKEKQEPEKQKHKRSASDGDQLKNKQGESGNISVSALMLAARFAKNARKGEHPRPIQKRKRKIEMMKKMKSLSRLASNIELTEQVLASSNGSASTKSGKTSPTSSLLMQTKKQTEEKDNKIKRTNSHMRTSTSSLLPISSLLMQTKKQAELKENKIKRTDSHMRTSSGSSSSLSLIARSAAEKRRLLEDVSCEMEEGHSMPLKDALKGLYRVNRYKTFIGACLWMIFVFLTFQVLSLVRDTDIVFEQESALEDLFLDEEFKTANFKKNFKDVMSLEELWEFMEGPLLQGAYPDEYYNGKQKSADDKSYILDVMKLVGGVRIRQHRVTSTSCQTRRFVQKNAAAFDDRTNPDGTDRKPFCVRAKLNETCEKDRANCNVNICTCGHEPPFSETNPQYNICPFDRLDQSCYSEYYTDTGFLSIDMFSIFLKKLTGWGIFKDTSHAELGSKFYPKFISQEEVNNKALPNRYTQTQLNSTLYSAIPMIGKVTGDFGTHGFYQDLPAENYTKAAEILEAMKQELWIDVQTRSVAITFQVYNTMSRYLTIARFTFEIENTGRIFSRGEFFTFPLIMYGGSGSSTIRFVLEVFMVLFAIYFVQREGKKLVKQGLGHYFCKRKSTIVEVLSMGFVLAFLIQFFAVAQRIQVAAVHFHVLQKHYTDLYTLAVDFQSVVFFGAFWFLIASIKFLKYLSISKQAVLLFRTVVEAKSLLVSFLCSMGLLIFLFAITTHFLYGSRLEDFHSFEMSLLQMLRWMVGDVDYNELHVLRPTWTPFVYSTFQLIFFFLALNMLIAIVINQFDVVQTQAKTESKWKREIPGFFEDLRIRWQVKTLRYRHLFGPWLCCCCFRCKSSLKIIKLLDMSRLEAKIFIKKQKKQNSQLTEFRDCFDEWKTANDLVMEFHKCKAMLHFQTQIRRLQRFGKTKKTGSGVNLYAFLEELYNSWEVRAMEGLEGGFETNDSRLPIAVISANRLAFFVCKTESFDAVNESSEMFAEKLETKIIHNKKSKRTMIVSAKSQRKSMTSRCTTCRCNMCNQWCSSCNNNTSNQSIRQTNSKLIQQGVNLAEKTVSAFYQVSTSIIVSPLNSNITDWSNATAIKGEKLRLSMSKDEIRGCLYECKCSSTQIGRNSKVRHIFVDETSAQLYILEKCNLQTRQEHFKATGPIRVIIDLFYLQQIHVDQIDERVLCLRLDDNVGRSFRLEFSSKRRRDTCIDLLVHSCRMFTGYVDEDHGDEKFVVYSSDDEDSSDGDIPNNFADYKMNFSNTQKKGLSRIGTSGRLINGKRKIRRISSKGKIKVEKGERPKFRHSIKAKSIGFSKKSTPLSRKNGFIRALSNTEPDKTSKIVISPCGKKNLWQKVKRASHISYVVGKMHVPLKKLQTEAIAIRSKRHRRQRRSTVMRPSVHMNMDI